MYVYGLVSMCLFRSPLYYNIGLYYRSEAFIIILKIKEKILRGGGGVRVFINVNFAVQY